MRFGFRATLVAVLSPLAVIACVAGENQCLNPQPDLPSCRASSGPGESGGSLGVTPGSAGGDGTSSEPTPGAPGVPEGSGGASSVGDLDAGAGEAAAGATGELGGAGGDSAIETGAGAGGNDDGP
ncbi:MAG TPA: hypothetical protein VGC79_04100 [Polyangiaceae bacterium]